jgi:hypothetical protein
MVLWPALIGCDRVVFDHSLAAMSVADGSLADGAATDASLAESSVALPSVGACSGMADGSDCDDRDVCTPGSTCRAGVCVGGNPYSSCVVADSAEDFGEEQGERGWSYGFWNAGADRDGRYDPATDFSAMAYCGSSTWKPLGRCQLVPGDAAFAWTSNLDWSLQHPETRMGLEIPVRRWTSDVSGRAVIKLAHRLSGETGDGTRALLYIDGVEAWRSDIAGGDRVGRAHTLAVDLRVGTVIEQLVHPLANSSDDMTFFSLIIEGE